MKHIIFAISIFLHLLAVGQNNFRLNKNAKITQHSLSENEAKKYEHHYFLGLKLKTLENFEEAIKNFEKCIEIEKKISAPHYEIALISSEIGGYEMAIKSIENAISIEPSNKWYILLYAEILFSIQDYNKTSDQYKKLIQITNNIEYYYKLAEVYIYQNDFKKAISVYDDLEKKSGFDKSISLQKHRLHRQINNISEAIKELEKILTVFSEDEESLEILSELYLLSDQKDKAFEVLKQLAEINPNNGRIHLTLADYYREKEDNKKSYEHLKNAFKSIELDVETKIRILVSYYQLIPINSEMRDQAYELIEILLKIYPENTNVINVYADILYTDKNYSEAKKQYLLVLENQKSNRQVWGQVLFILAEEEDYNSILETSKEALEYFPLEPLFYYFNAASNRTLENYEQAIDMLLTGKEFIVDNENLLVEMNSLLGDLYNSTGNYEESDSYYEAVLKIDSNNAVVLNNYAYYLSLRKKSLLKAKAMSQRCNEIQPNNGTYQDTYAWILYQLGDYEEAKKWLEQALNNGASDSPVVVEHYGDVLYKLGLKDEALLEWNNAKKLGGSRDKLEKKINEKKLNDQ